MLWSFFTQDNLKKFVSVIIQGKRAGRTEASLFRVREYSSGPFRDPLQHLALDNRSVLTEREHEPRQSPRY